MNPWRSTFDSQRIHPGGEREGALARRAAGRTGPHHLPRVVRPVQRTGAERKDRVPRRHCHQQATVQTAAALFGRYRPGADPGRAHRHDGRFEPRGFVMARQMQPRAGRAFDVLVFKFAPEADSQAMLKLEVEINTREHEPLFGIKSYPFAVESDWYQGKTEIASFEPEVILGTKLRALLQRRKNRGLFDLHHGLDQLAMDPDKLISCFDHYLALEGNPITRAVARVDGLLSSQARSAELKKFVRLFARPRAYPPMISPPTLGWALQRSERLHQVPAVAAGHRVDTP